MWLIYLLKKCMDFYDILLILFDNIFIKNFIINVRLLQNWSKKGWLVLHSYLKYFNFNQWRNVIDFIYEEYIYSYNSSKFMFKMKKKEL